MKKNWYFSLDNGEKDYLSDSAVEIFKTKGDDANAFKSLAREVIQNSLDAKREDVDAPLVLDFQFINLNRKSFPGIERLKSHIDGTVSFCEENEKKNIALFNSKKRSEILEQDSFTVLKISDYNTKGVSGSKNLNSKKNKWKGLIYNDGDSIKDKGNSLGSFGLGKNASFAISSLRTVFYVTRDMDDNYAMEGVAKLYTSYINGNKYLNEGYFCNEENGKTYPLTEDEALSISKIFERKEKGTDVIIFEPNISLIKDRVKWYLIESIISNFFVAFIEGMLEVKVDGTEINQNQIHNVFLKLMDFYHYHNEEISQKLISVKQYLETIEYGDDYSGDLDYFGFIYLKLLKSPETKYKNIAIFREGGMLIKEHPVNFANQKFSGVLIVKGKEGNNFLKSIEDPNHTDFDPSRETGDVNSTAASRKSRLNSFYSWISQNVKEFTRIESGESIALSGMEDYIQMFENGEYSKKGKKDIFINKIKRNKKKEKDRLYEKKGVVEGENGLDVPEVPHNEGGIKPVLPNDFDHPTKELLENPSSETKGFIKMYTASFAVPPIMKFEKNICSLIFKTTTNNKILNVKIAAIGEDGKENTYLPKIIDAYNSDDELKYKIRNNVIYGVNSSVLNKITLVFSDKINTRIKVFVYWEEV